MTPPDVVFAHEDGVTYVAGFLDEPPLRGGNIDSVDVISGWWRWPAERHGWRQRVRCSEATAEAALELPPALGRLALRLSGVPTDDH
jgi:hypothetical protein